MKPIELRIQSIRNKKCDLCDLADTAKTICIIGSGNTPAKLMFIGEAPGEEEDIKGEVFIGKAGKMLDSILLNLNMKREDIYITNVIKCHPQYNHKPSVSKLELCSSVYLRKEIQLVKPELIVCLGGMSAKTLLQDANIQVGNVRNTVWHTKGPLPQGIPFIVTYHPAATFHQPELLEFIINDFDWAKRLLNGELPKPKKKSNYQQVTSIWDIPEIKLSRWIDIDLETDGLDPHIDGKEILSVQISTKENEGYYLDWTSKIAKQLKILLAMQGNAINGHNIKFDLNWLRIKAGIIFDGTLNDTIQNIHLLDENFSNKSLDTLATTFTDLRGHKGEFQKLVNNYVRVHKEKKEPISKARSRLWGQAFKAIDIKKRIMYGCGDADATLKLRNEFRPKIEKEGLIPLHNLMMNITKVYSDIECNGIRVDEGLIEEFDLKYQKRLAKLNKSLIRLGGDINHNAPLQLRQLLYGNWKLTPHEIRMGKKRVRYSSGKAALDLILQDDISEATREYITYLQEYRKLNKLHGTYIKGMPRYLRKGFIHATWNLVGTDTGRTSCNNPNLQQIPRTGDIKQLFRSRFKDGVLLQIDVSQGELRIAAQVSKEKNLTHLFREGGNDIHRSVAASIYHRLPDDITDEQRFNAKTVNFLILYGGGIKTLAQAIKTDDSTAAKLLRTWNKQFPGWKDYVAEVEEGLILRGYVRNLFGRYRRLYIGDPTTPEGHTLLRVGVNAPIQGGLSDYNKLCGYSLWEETKQFNGEVLFIAETHDAWTLDMRKKHVPRIASMAKYIFENPRTSEFGFKFDVPMKVDIKVGNNWKDMEEYES